MAGNVGEWVDDTYTDYPGGSVTNPRHALGQSRVVRGGSWAKQPDSALETVNRRKFDTKVRNDQVGFRCVH